MVVTITTMSPNLREWQRRVLEMQQCKRVAELLARHGEPHHKVQQAGFEIWHVTRGLQTDQGISWC